MLASLHGLSPQAVRGGLRGGEGGALSLRRKSYSQGSKCDFNLMRVFRRECQFLSLRHSCSLNALEVSLLVGVGGC